MNENIEALKAKYPSFQYEEAKKVGYSDDEIFDFLFDLAQEEKQSYVEVSWNEKVAAFSIEHPFPFWISFAFIFLFFALVLIIFAWKIVKTTLYQIVYTITKARKDANMV
jgi:hypothetical protein